MSLAMLQPRLLTVPIVGLMPIEIDEANRLLVAWGHKLGPVNRPFRMEAWALEVDGEPLAVSVSASTVSAVVTAYHDRLVDGEKVRVLIGRWRRDEAVELARLCAVPGNDWINRVMLRLWREVCAPRWNCWPVKVAVSYSHNAMHRGELYRADAWTKCQENCGSGGGGAWTRPRYATDVVHGSKTLWIWRYDHAR